MNGVVVLDKPEGKTSHDMVNFMRRLTGIRRIGHTGTLDPMATGVLPICIGSAAKAADMLMLADKRYTAELALGITTDTEDISGNVITRENVSVEKHKTEEAVKSFVGESEQIPPMYSAVKVNGRKLYEYARAGEEVERPVRQVTIYEFTRTSEISYEESLARFRFRVKCSKGTYIRTLSVDLGQKLGYAAHMSHLTRTSAAGLSLDDALTLDEVAEKVGQGDLSFLHPLEIGTGDLEKVELTAQEVGEVQVGRFIPVESEANELAAFYQGKLVAILEKREEHYKPRKVFRTESVLQ